jgi:hypothetical protein
VRRAHVLVPGGHQNPVNVAKGSRVANVAFGCSRGGPICTAPAPLALRSGAIGRVPPRRSPRVPPSVLVGPGGRTSVRLAEDGEVGEGPARGLAGRGSGKGTQAPGLGAEPGPGAQGDTGLPDARRAAKLEGAEDQGHPRA